MNLNNFEKQISRVIVDRGYDYYKDGNIIEIYQEGDNEYKCIVEGSEDYEVSVQIDKEWNIIHSYCDCPYDFGPTCKHEAAVYFKLFEVLSNKDKVKCKLKKQASLMEILECLNKEELITIIEEVSNNDSDLKKSLIFKYSKCDDEN